MERLNSKCKLRGRILPNTHGNRPRSCYLLRCESLPQLLIRVSAPHHVASMQGLYSLAFVVRTCPDLVVCQSHVHASQVPIHAAVVLQPCNAPDVAAEPNVYQASGAAPRYSWNLQEIQDGLPKYVNPNMTLHFYKEDIIDLDAVQCALFRVGGTGTVQADIAGELLTLRRSVLQRRLTQAGDTQTSDQLQC
jgi:hypothetical protein